MQVVSTTVLNTIDSETPSLWAYSLPYGSLEISGSLSGMYADVELRSASVLDYRIWRPRGRVTMLYGSLGTHRALSQI